MKTTERLTRGMIVVDRRPPAPWRETKPNCRVALRVYAARALELFEEVVCPESP